MTKERPNLSEYFSFEILPKLMQVVKKEENPIHLWASITSVVPLQRESSRMVRRVHFIM